MKFFILTLIGLVVLFFLSSCGLIQTHSYDKQQVKFLKEYSGLYVFDKALRDEMRQIEGERKRKRKEFMDDWFKTHEFFTKDDLPLLDKIVPPPKSSPMVVDTLLRECQSKKRKKPI